MAAARFAVDWDGTCVTDVWPEHGEWLPGAADALRALERLGKVVIYSCRVAPVEHPSADWSEDDQPRDPRDVDKEFRGIYEMLSDEGLGHIEIWARPYKPPAAVYIDDRALRFEGDWERTLEQVLNALAPVDDDLWSVKATTAGAMQTYFALDGPPRTLRQFDSGATRDTDEGKLDYEGFLSPRVLERFAEYMHKHRVQSDGSVRASDNWQKGIPFDAYMKSGFRHFMDWWMLHRDSDEVDDTTPETVEYAEEMLEAIMALLFNAMGYAHELLEDVPA